MDPVNVLAVSALLILEDLRTDVKLLTGNGTRRGLKSKTTNLLWIYGALATFEYKTGAFCSSLNAKEIGTS